MRSLRLVAAVVAGSAVCWTAVPGTPIAAAPVADGWQRVFAEDFAADSLPRQCTVFDGVPGGQTAAYYRPDEAQVSGGMLRLSIRRRDYNERPYTSGGLGCYGVSQVYGRYEYRARAAPGVGIDSQVTLWPEGGADEDATVVEISAGDRDREVLRLSTGSGVTRREAGGRFEDDFHEYVIEWAPSGMRVSVDGVLKAFDNRVSAKRRWFGFAVSTGDTALPSPSMLPSEFLVDWVRIYSYAPGAKGLEPTGSPVISSSNAAARSGGTGRSDLTALVLLIALTTAISSYIGVQCARRRHSTRLR